jgi:hypothetical protein
MFTIDPIDVLKPIVAFVYPEVQLPLFFALLYKSNVFFPIPTSSYVLAFIANNQATLNTPASSTCFSF